MNIKRFQAEDMRGAIRKVREAMGPDAVILSNHRVEGGVEIVAAMDYDESLIGKAAAETKGKVAAASAEPRDKLRQAALDDIRYGRNVPTPELHFSADPGASFKAAEQAAARGQAQLWSGEPALMEMHNELKSLRGMLVSQLSELAWGQETRYHPLRARLLQRLLALGLSSALARDLASRCDEAISFDHNWRKILGLLAHQLPVSDNPVIEQGGIVALVGATGVGKTTSIAKLAARYALLHGPQSVALITTDNFRVAAHEQLRSYARIMGVPMVVAADAAALQQALARLAGKGLVLIDTAGMSQRAMELSQHLALLQSGGRAIQTYLTLATNSQRGVLNETVQAYREIPLAGCILTKIDETTSLGGALAVAIEQDLPIAYYSDGQRVPEDLHPARAHNLISRSVSIMQQMAAGNRDENISLALGGMVAQAHG
jgi:flagellar biosynthesis protein FlhF